MKDKKCEHCTGEVTEEKLEHKVAIPESILSVDSIHAQTNRTYIHNHYKFCTEKCYNLAIIDDLINEFNFALIVPEEKFLDPIKDVQKAKRILQELEDFKTIYAS